ncbi:MAG: transcriptional regulator [Rhodobacterales bacterium]|nr:MAG: transcriptional regulator [Rhodobacterales bacterium]
MTNTALASTDSTELKTSSERSYQALRGDIVRGELPAGSKLKVLHLKDRYDTGAAPLREALSRLVGDGLVDQEGQRGFSVAKVSAQDAKDVARVRVLLECEALREAIPQGGDDWESGVVAAYHRLSLVEKRGTSSVEDLIELETRNAAFHDALIAGVDCDWLLKLRKQIYLHHERYRYISRKLTSSNRDTPAEHAAIYEAALARDVERTCALSTDHINLTTQTVLTVL